MRLLFNLLIFSLAFPAIADCQQVIVTAAFDTTKILVGDHTGFNITVEKPRDMKVIMPVFKDTLSSHIEIIAGPQSDSADLPGNRRVITNKYLVTSFDSGYHRIDPVFIESDDENGLKRYYSGIPALEVARYNVAPADTSQKIYDIVEPYRAPVTLGEIMPWLLLVIVIGIIAFLIYRYFRLFRREKKVTTEVVNTDPAHVIAFRELENLRDMKLWQAGETKKYYTRLTEILRLYLENRYGVYSLEMTTSETLVALVKTGFRKDESYDKLNSVLSVADLVKFAKYKPDAPENEQCFEKAWGFIDVTKQEIIISGKTNENGNEINREGDK